MLTRLKVTGFKNLVDVDLRFGPFTCITGANGIGKSNLFDAIAFLGALADATFMEAAKSVRGNGERLTDIRNLFHRVGNEFAQEMAFDAEMVIPERGSDDLGLEVKAKITFLCYRVVIGYKHDFGGLELLHEELTHINLGSAPHNLLFPHKASAWRYSAVKGRRSGGAFISTQGVGKNRVIELHADGEAGGRPRTILASNLRRTVLSTVNTGENPTALMARREMQSWRRFTLEPDVMRRPDSMNAPTILGRDGAHLAATLYRLQKREDESSSIYMVPDHDDAGASKIYARLADMLAEFGDGAGRITLDHDENRDLLTLIRTGPDGTPFPAGALSDGTLRFLALAVIAMDSQSPGLICLKEPENGISPDRMQAMMGLLLDIPTDVQRPIGPDNTLRQVIIITYSPGVLAKTPDDSLLYADSVEKMRNGAIFNAIRFSCLPDTWRHKTAGEINTIERDRIFPRPFSSSQQITVEDFEEGKKKSLGEAGRKVGIGEQVQPSLPYGEEK